MTKGTKLQGGPKHCPIPLFVQIVIAFSVVSKRDDKLFDSCVPGVPFEHMGEVGGGPVVLEAHLLDRHLAPRRYVNLC